MENIKLSIIRIKQTLRWFPGLVLGLGRQVGKTQAILEVIHDDFHGEGYVYSMNQTLSAACRLRYKDMYPNDPQPVFVSSPSHVRGNPRNIWADEWWGIPIPDRRDLLATGRVMARIGTEFETRNIDASVIRFTKEELTLLSGALENAIYGSPEKQKINRDILRKVKSAILDGKDDGEF